MVADQKGTGRLVIDMDDEDRRLFEYHIAAAATKLERADWALNQDGPRDVAHRAMDAAADLVDAVNALKHAITLLRSAVAS